MSANFVHLRVHSAYSLSEGAIRTGQLAKLCTDLGMPAVAVTDTNNLFGALEASTTLMGAGIQPLIGCQLSVKVEASTDAAAGGRPGEVHPHPVVALVQNDVGYRNLLRLIAEAYAHIEAEPACVSVDALCAHADGLILLTGGPDGLLGRALTQGKRADADRLVRALHHAFADRLYIELQRHGLEHETAAEGALLAIARAHDLPIVATNDVYFATRDMFSAHDALICIAEGAYLASEQRRRLTPEHYLKSAAEMAALFADLPDAIANTAAIARRCAFAVEQRKPMLPPYDCGNGRTETDVVAEQAKEGLRARLAAAQQGGAGIAAGATEQDYWDRLDFELGVICRMGFAGYFLIVAEFIGVAKRAGIPVGPGRGSGAGSLVAWSLGITDLDPIRFGLLFERFLNPERVSMPDFDIDFCQDRRDEVIRHVQTKYGADHVAQIITFGKLQARAVLRDVGRVMGLPYTYVDKICKLVPNNPANPITLPKAIEAEPQLQAYIAEDEAVARLVDVAIKLEGLYRHVSTHAAGVVISDRPLVDLIPLYRDPRSDLLVSGFNMKWVEAAGLVKFDFLGLKTLTMLAKALELLREGRGIDIDLAHLPFDDKPTFEMLGRGDTMGVFQLESSGMRDVLRKLKPDTFEDIIAVVALYRPGPMDNIPSYIRRKHGEEEIDYLYPSLEGILRETYGIIIYQEQVMQIAQVLSGYSLGSADLLRRAMGKKIKSEMDKQRETFVSGATGRNVPDGKAKSIFDLVAKFAGYGFNKSHAAAYALIAYQTAYLKANHPLEFLAASMSLDIANSDRLNAFRQELGRLGIRLLPPDINASGTSFTVEYAQGADDTHGIRYPLSGVKTVGEPAARALIDGREQGGRYDSLLDFATRLADRAVNKRQFEYLAKAGAFDGLNPNRRQTVESAEAILHCAGDAGPQRDAAQIGLFSEDAWKQATRLQVADVVDWPLMERLAQELEAVGFYLSAHPLDAFGGALKRLKVTRFAELLHNGRSGSVLLAGTVISRKERTSSKGSKYAFVQLSDTSGVFEVTVFSELLAEHRDLLVAGSCLLLDVSAQVDGESVRCVVNKIETVEKAVERLADTLEIALDGPEALPQLQSVLAAGSPGRGQVKLLLWLGIGTEVELKLPMNRRITGELVGRMRALPGVREVRFA